jgi:hypothetical protein
MFTMRRDSRSPMLRFIFRIFTAVHGAIKRNALRQLRPTQTAFIEPQVCLNSY